MKVAMLRITEYLESGNTLRLRLDGTVSAVSLPDLEEICSRHQENGAEEIVLDFAGVVFMNDDAARKFVELRSDRLRIINCSPFIETLLETVEK
jgi:anti-anti-sigma regulatory factor